MTIGYIIRSLFALLIVAFGLWPYLTIFHLDGALHQSDATAIEEFSPYVNLPAIQAHYKTRLDNTVTNVMPTNDGAGHGDQVLNWVAGNFKLLGDAALKQKITIDWVRTSLNEAAERATAERPASFISAIDFAFFESWDRVVIRIGALDRQPTYAILSLNNWQWQLTDVIRSCW
ncbi:DUF2939 domain-containing protein [Rhodoferax sp. 4810]|uniref:DUF2939 domain-containing protein n=1 Tax=Thiospirillum jenense TaxID=1653858 RepID=A0A839HCQ8_9GAMM|nr:DUF2939 domain-containing protein [Thiospirillum jenense]MBB1075096.1 DUF2939 domain-containing protein [Rhodoferax jenense]MBB1126745.1 DUF2939 domain-containing protein [Thiospirillum jenense]